MRPSDDDAWTKVDKQREAVAAQRKRLEWTVHGSTRDLQTMTQQSPIQVDKLLEALELALEVTKELKRVNVDAAELGRF